MQQPLHKRPCHIHSTVSSCFLISLYACLYSAFMAFSLLLLFLSLSLLVLVLHSNLTSREDPTESGGYHPIGSPLLVRVLMHASSAYGWLSPPQDPIPGTIWSSQANRGTWHQMAILFSRGLCLIISIGPSRTILHSSLPWGLTSLNCIACAPLLSYFLLGLANGEHWKKIRWWKREKLGYLLFTTPTPQLGYGFNGAQPLSLSHLTTATILSSVLLTVLFSSSSG